MRCSCYKGRRVVPGIIGKGRNCMRVATLIEISLKSIRVVTLIEISFKSIRAATLNEISLQSIRVATIANKFVQ